MFTRPVRLGNLVVLLCLAFSVLVGCKSSEERAADAFAQALQLMEDGDAARAGVAFQNVFKYAPTNTEARGIYAGFLRETGKSDEAAGQYLRLLEQRPDDLPALVAMVELAMESYRWDVAQPHLIRAQEIAPDRADIVALGHIMEYVLGVGNSNVSRQDEAIAGMAAAQEVRLLPLSRALSDGWLRREKPEAALATIDAALGFWPQDRALHDQRLLALQSLARPDAVADQFRAMIALFPESRNITARYVDWLARSDQLDVAEDFLRERTKVSSAGVPRILDLIEFLARWKGPDAVLADLDTLVERDKDPLLFRAMRATVVFQNGAQEEAIADLRAIIAEAAASSIDATRADATRYSIVLARMLDRSGDRAGAEAAIAPVIAERPNLADAALLYAQFLLDKGHNAEAVAILRAALGADESDPQLLVLLARAHSAQGADALATRTLSLAFAASGQSPEIALTFAAHLAENGRNDSASDVLTRALSVRPLHPGMLAAAGRLYLANSDWNRAARIAQTLRDLNGGPETDRAAEQLDLAILAARAPLDDVLASIRARNPSTHRGAMDYVTLVQAYMAAERTAEARRVLDQGLETAPDNGLLLAMSARLAVVEGQSERAIQIYRALITQDPDNEYLWVSMAKAVAAGSDTDAVLAVLDEGLAVQPDSLRLGWERALVLHQSDRADDAISAYEALHARAPDNISVKNNLANLLSTAREDDASLTRAADLARALERSEIPQFRNTLGWIRFRQGDVTSAINLLVPAAESLTDDPLAQIQAAEALIAASQISRARIFATRAMNLAQPDTEISARVLKALEDIAALKAATEG